MRVLLAVAALSLAVGGTAPGAGATTPPSGATESAAERVLWVDPGAGRNGNPGSRGAPLRTVAAAWNRIPARTDLTTPVRIMLRPGTYSARSTPGYWESRWGTTAAPITLQSVRPRRAVLRGDLNLFDVRHLVVRDIAVDRSGDVFHCERCSHVTLTGVRFTGRGDAHETVKVNQSDHIDILRSDIAGAYENAIDFVAVQYATIAGNRIHGAEDWCAYAKGGSAYVAVTGNHIFDCGTGGFTAGQGTGVEFMVAPWLRYETYGVTVMNNVIHDTEGAGLGVNGGYNTVMAHNTLYRVGARSHAVEFVHGGRSCDGDTAACAERRALGGWGGVDVDGQYIPNRRTAFLNNVIVNPPGAGTRWQHFQLDDPVDPPAGSGVPAPSRADEDLVIAGNVISNGGTGMPTGLAGDRERQVLRDNRVNEFVPQFADAGNGDFRPRGELATLTGAAMPEWTWADSGGVPVGGVPVLPPSAPPGALAP